MRSGACVNGGSGPKGRRRREDPVRRPGPACPRPQPCGRRGPDGGGPGGPRGRGRARRGRRPRPRGQSEAGYAIGLGKSQVMRLILLPQAVRAMLPAIVSQLVVLLKDTALGFIITYPELLYAAKQIGGRGSFDFPYVASYLIAGAIYIAICGSLSAFAYWLQRRMGTRTPRERATARPPARCCDGGPRL